MFSPLPLFVPHDGSSLSKPRQNHTGTFNGTVFIRASQVSSSSSNESIIGFSNRSSGAGTTTGQYTKTGSVLPELPPNHWHAVGSTTSIYRNSACTRVACGSGKELVGYWERTGRGPGAPVEWIEFADDGSFAANEPSTREIIRGKFGRADSGYVLRPSSGQVREVSAKLDDGLLVWDDGATYRRVDRARSAP